MKISHPKQVVIDVDGVLLNWIDSFDTWFRSSGLSSALRARDPGDERVNGYELHSRYQLDSTQIATAIRVFNSTIHAELLPAMPGAIKYVRKLVEEGYSLYALTAFSADFKSHQLRYNNLVNKFGAGTFDGYTFLPLRASKKDHFSNFPAGTLYIDDHISHVNDALECGLDSILYDPNELFTKKDGLLVDPGVIYKDTWAELYEAILGA